MTKHRVLALLCALACAVAPLPALPCALVLPPGARAHLADESALIIWDAAGGTQHFIRRAAFETAAKDFGFLVPTLGVPELAEAGDVAFDYLAMITAPKIIVLPRDSGPGREIKAAAAAPPVTVVATAQVAGYDAVVLEATDAAALDRWLKDHGYVSGPALVEWFRPYVAQGWKITAFKIARDPKGGERVSASAVRMSFRTDKPFFPYREPSGGAKGDRLLRIFVLGEARFGGAIGERGAWPGETVWSDRLSEGVRETLLKFVKLPEDAAPGALWLTEFEDRSSPRPAGGDVFFAPAGDQSPVKRPDVMAPDPSFWGPPAIVVGVLLAVLALVAWLFWRGVRWLEARFGRRA